MRFRSRRGGPDESPEDPTLAPDDDAGADEASVSSRADGPWDESELEDPRAGRVDLGGMLIRPRDGVELRLQLDQQSGALVSTLLAAHDGAVELRAFAAAKDVDLWDRVRNEIADGMRSQGSVVTEHDGAYGVELHIEQPVDVQGKAMIQPSTMVGIRGPRWILRATFYGKYASDPAGDSELVAAMRDTVVVRGAGAMSPGEGIPLRMPPDVELEQVKVHQR